MHLKTVEPLLLAWIGLTSAWAFLLFGFDKWRAGRTGARRVAESSLLLASALGGWPGGLLGILLFRHKSAKLSFQVRFAAAFVVWAALVAGALKLLKNFSLPPLAFSLSPAMSDDPPFGQNPFTALDSAGLPPGPENPPPAAVPAMPPKKNRGRVDILRTTAHRGGKTVTVVKGFVGIGLPEKEQLAKKMQKACGTGGTVKEGRIEIQGDKREEVARILTEAGFRPVFAGG